MSHLYGSAAYLLQRRLHFLICTVQYNIQCKKYIEDLLIDNGELRDDEQT